MVHFWNTFGAKIRQVNMYYHALENQLMSIWRFDNYSWGILDLVNKLISVDKTLKYTLSGEKRFNVGLYKTLGFLTQF